MVNKYKHKGPVNNRVIKQMEASCGVEQPLSCNLSEDNSGQLEAHQIYLEENPDAAETWEELLSNRLDNLLVDREVEAESSIQHFMRKQQVHNCWRRINALIAKEHLPR